MDASARRFLPLPFSIRSFNFFFFLSLFLFNRTRVATIGNRGART